jgi:hypothetical protein
LVGWIRQAKAGKSPALLFNDPVEFDDWRCMLFALSRSYANRREEYARQQNKEPILHSWSLTICPLPTEGE